MLFPRSVPSHYLNQCWIIVNCTLGNKCNYNYTPTQQSCWGYIGFTSSVRQSVGLYVRPSSRVHSVAPTVLVGCISYLYILSSNFRRCVECKVSCKIRIFGNFLKFLMWITSMHNHVAVGGISECRRSSWHLNQNTTIFIQENALENVVCKMSAILSRPQCFNTTQYCIQHNNVKRRT